MSNRSRRGGVFFTKARMRSMTSAARLPSLTMRSRACRASSRLGGCAASQRIPALAFVTAAAIGWLISWAYRGGQCPHGSHTRDVCQFRLGVLKRFLRMFPVGQVEHEGKALVASLEGCRADEHRHPAAVFPEVLFF